MYRILCLILIGAFLLTGCDSYVSREEYDKVVSERDALLGNDASSSATSVSQPNGEPEEGESSEKEEIPQREDADFRNVKWGDSRETVLASESAPLYGGESAEDIQDVNNVLYETSLSNIKCYLLYKLDDSVGLYSARYLSAEEHSTENLYISDYEALREALESKYGSPISDEYRVFLDKGQYEYVQNEARSLLYGHVMYVLEWETERTKISLVMYSDNYAIRIFVEYVSKEIVPPLDTSGF